METPTRTFPLSKAVRVAATVVLAVVVVPIVGDFFSSIASEMGLYAKPIERLRAMVAWAQSIFGEQGFYWLVFGIAGFAAGLWLDSLLLRRERKPAEDAIIKTQIDRQALAGEIEVLARNISTLVAEGEARRAIAWEQDTRAMYSRDRAAPHIPVQDQTATARAWLVEKYGERFHAEAWRLISLAGKLSRLDADALWRLQHILSTGHDVDSMARFLMGIAADLRHSDHPTLPTFNSRMEAFKAAESARQLPQDTGSETPL